MFHSGSSSRAWANLSHTGHVYSATENGMVVTVVLIVVAGTPHFEFVSFSKRLFLVQIFILVFSMCF